jgi:hypothetical protein
MLTRSEWRIVPILRFLYVQRGVQPSTRNTNDPLNYQLFVVVKFPLQTSETPLGSIPLFDPRQKENKWCTTFPLDLFQQLE